MTLAVPERPAAIRADVRTCGSAVDRQRLAQQLASAGITDVHFVDATTILKGDREFGVFVHRDQGT